MALPLLSPPLSSVVLPPVFLHNPPTNLYASHTHNTQLQCTNQQTNPTYTSHMYVPSSADPPKRACNLRRRSKSHTYYAYIHI